MDTITPNTVQDGLKFLFLPPYDPWCSRILPAIEDRDLKTIDQLLVRGKARVKLYNARAELLEKRAKDGCDDTRLKNQAMLARSMWYAVMQNFDACERLRLLVAREKS